MTTGPTPPPASSSSVSDAFRRLRGVYCAAVTPLDESGRIPIDAMVELLEFLAGRGCHGALLFGTTGEGPSFAPAERTALLQGLAEFRRSRPDFRLLVGTGTPSLEETIALTRAAFDLGASGVVVLPPYYFRKVSDDGLFAWFSQVIRQAVPAGGAFLGYHIPGVSGVPLSLDLLSRLKEAFPDRFAGLKDSSGDPEHARQLGEHFGAELLVLNGNDRLLTHALQNGAGGCITALANLRSPDLRRVWDAFQRSEAQPEAQARLDAARAWMDHYPPAPPLLKAMLARQHGFPRWEVRPPLLPLSAEMEAQAAAEAQAEAEAQSEAPALDTAGQLPIRTDRL